MTGCPLTWMQSLRSMMMKKTDKMITEMAVAEMDIPVGCLGHMVGVVEAHITVAEEVIPAMRHDSGYDDTKWDSAFKDGEDGWGDLPGGKIQSHLAGRPSQVVGGTRGSDRGGSSWGGDGASGGGRGHWSGVACQCK
ncbi:uncharacterized protein LOC122279770 isoform X3 [Carya illinoinensis]|uniref:uncharacterized protein LOC122279770 isoform X3 n=1 Tax=Carya illinoinensis TaxID=32201 RepID=UPI001C718050|nr:uncharacterized protein LOC122279770 isoform X3 [Carya illinoinensis]